MIKTRAGIALVLYFLGPAVAAAQDSSTDAATRAATIAAQQAEKAREAQPYVPGRAERLFQRFEERGLPFLSTPRGFYPALGSVYPGGGFALGAGFREFTGDRAIVDVHALYSIATYKRVEATYRAPGLARDRVEINARGGWLDAPRIGYFGLGADSDRADRSAFGLRETYAESGVTWRPTRLVELGAGAAYEAYDQRPGTGRSPSIETLFTEATAPRLGDDPTFAKTSLSAAVLWTATPAYARAGGLLRLTYDGYSRLDESGSFGVTRTEIVQHIPIMRETWILSLRARAESLVGTEADAPYFLLPSLGSGSTLRAYPTGRFRDRRAALFTGEWRWLPNRLLLDVALFADAGTVGRTWSDLANNTLKTDFGIGIRLHAPAVTALRIDLARGSEGLRLVLTSTAAF